MRVHSIVLAIVKVDSFNGFICWLLNVIDSLVTVMTQRNAVKRLCIKSLPPVLCIQLKRFDYDWELNRAIKFDDYFKVCC